MNLELRDQMLIDLGINTEYAPPEWINLIIDVLLVEGWHK